MVAENGAFSFPVDKGGEVVKAVPFVFVPNLIKKIADMVSEHERHVDTRNLILVAHVHKPIGHQRD